MKKLLLICLALCLVFLMVAVASAADKDKAETVNGYVTDSKCGAKGAKDAHADCAASCVKGGASPVFVTGGKVYKIDDASKVADHVGHKVTITGELKGDTVEVKEVKM